MDTFKVSRKGSNYIWLLILFPWLSDDGGIFINLHQLDPSHVPDLKHLMLFV
jgi:hypothetical protein